MEIDTGCIDAILSSGDGGCHCFYEDTKSFARAELAQLHAAAASADNMRDSLHAWVMLWSHICKRLGVDDDTLPNESNFDGMIEDFGNWLNNADELQRTVTAQAAQLEQAQRAMSPFASIGDVLTKQSDSDDSPWTKIQDDQDFVIGWMHMTVTAGQLREASRWLAANAPAPQEERTE